MTSRAAVLALSAALLVFDAGAQSLPSDQRKPALTRKENWGLSLGIDLITVRYEPTRCMKSMDTGAGIVLTEEGSCEDVPHAYGAQGFGLGLNVGFVFLRHILFGGEVWTVGFGGTRTFTTENPPSSYRSETTNSLAGAVYAGVLSSPMGGAESKIGRKLWLGAIAGKSHWSGQRRLSAPSCSDCAYIPMRMGYPAFVEPFAIFGGGDRDGGGGFRLAYRHHFGGFEAIHSAMTLGLFFAFGKL